MRQCDLAVVAEWIMRADRRPECWDLDLGPRMTLPTQLVLRALLADPTQKMYGLQICTEAGLPSGTIHPILARLEHLGWVESLWEDIDSHAEGRPRRRYYQLTKDGAELARDALARATTPLSTVPGLLRPSPAGGQA